MIQSEIGGGTPVNRPEAVGFKSRMIKKMTGKATWFEDKPKEKRELGETDHTIQKAKRRKKQEGRTETVLFVPHTP